MESRVALQLGEIMLALEHMGYIIDPLPEAELIHLEGELGVQLPYEYKEFLLRIGYKSGPYRMWSPNRILAELGRPTGDQGSLPEESIGLADLQSLLEASESLEDLCEFLETDNVDGVQEFWKFLSEYKRQYSGPPQPSRPFQFTRAQAEKYNRSVPEESNRPWLTGLYPANGSITIADDGGEYDFYVLVINGDAAGSVWEVTGEYLTAWRPARRPRGVSGIRMGGRNPLPHLSATPTFLEWYCSWIEQRLVDLCADPKGYLNLGLVYLKLNEYWESIKYWDKMILTTPDNSLAYYYRGLALLRLHQMALAAANFKTCLSRNPDPWTRARAKEQLDRLAME
jgi:tetratricopeptide (TPR) repeat protein